VAASRRNTGIFWAHNDSGEPVIFALNQQGSIKGRVRVTGASVEDWEDIAVAACPSGTCVYIADIGDNDGERNQITVYRVPEPAPGDTATAAAEALTAFYPDGPHDAESVFVTRESDIFIVTKGAPGSVALYRLRRPLGAGSRVQLERVGNPLAGDDVDAANRPTAADISPDGRWVAVRTTRWVAFYPASELLEGRWQEAFRFELAGLNEARGEGITFADANTLVLVGERGSRLRGAGTFARLTCEMK
jgi:hypothetical protein